MSDIIELGTKLAIILFLFLFVTDCRPHSTIYHRVLSLSG